MTTKQFQRLIGRGNRAHWRRLPAGCRHAQVVAVRYAIALQLAQRLREDLVTALADHDCTECRCSGERSCDACSLAATAREHAWSLDMIADSVAGQLRLHDSDGHHAIAASARQALDELLPLPRP